MTSALRVVKLANAPILLAIPPSGYRFIVDAQFCDNIMRFLSVGYGLYPLDRSTDNMGLGPVTVALV